MCNKSDEFVDFVLQNNLDLVAISETWFKPDDNLVPHECTPAGYSLHHIPRPKKTGGGVALLFRSSLSVSIKNDNIDYLTFESLHAEITCNSRSVRLVNKNRPERDVDGKHVNFSSFLQEFEKLIVNYLLHPSDIILTGDFNIHMDNTSNTYANQFKDLLSAHGIRKYLNQSAAEQIIHAFVTSRLDNGNALFYGLPQNQIYISSSAHTKHSSSCCNFVQKVMPYHSNLERTTLASCFTENCF